MKVGFIGAGKVGTAFGRYLHDCGEAVGGYFDRHPEKVAHAAGATGSAACRNVSEVASRSDVILITTRDDQIADACSGLCREVVLTADHAVGHMSGAHASDILSPARMQGTSVFSLHPLQAFAEEEKALSELPDTFFSLEGTKSQLKSIEALMQRLGNPYFTISAEHKSLYHLSACMLSNYLLTLMDAGLRALQESGIDPRRGFQAMRPLIEGTLANIAGMGTAKALTGPIARGDCGTIAEHIDSLDRNGLSELKTIYTFLGLKTLDLASREILQSAKKIEAVRRLLD
jgi:predicted short-subunit dehydrogenase-like oxidoreductase (DUF2520 family)